MNDESQFDRRYSLLVDIYLKLKLYEATIHHDGQTKKNSIQFDDESKRRQMCVFFSSRWKLHEACLLAMGRCKQLLNDMLVTGYVKIDLDSFVRQVPLADLSQFGNK